MLRTVFDEYGTKRLAAWRQFRDSLEASETPLEDVAKLWTYAPFVSPYLDPKIPTEWPDPWHLMLDLRLDDLALVIAGEGGGRDTDLVLTSTGCAIDRLHFFTEDFKVILR